MTNAHIIIQHTGHLFSFYLMIPLAPKSASELLTRSTSVPVGASSIIVVWKVDEVKTGTLSFTSLTRTVTVPVPLRDGEPEGLGKKKKNSERKCQFSKI